MNLKGKTLSEHLASQNKKKFPFNGSVDYRLRYRNIKEYMDNNIHPLVELSAYKIDGMQLTKHGTEHIDTVIQKASELLDIAGIELSPYEVYLLLIAIQIHDSGHIFSGRKKHEVFTAEIIQRMTILLGDETAEKRVIFQIAEAHGGYLDNGDKDKLSLLKTSDRILNQPVKIQLLASVLRLADELADDFTRATSDPNIEKSSEVYHKYASALHNVEVDHTGKQMNLTFCLEKEDVLKKYGKHDEEVFLIDEIFERVFKTYIETVYCQRFMPHPLTFDTVYAKIEFIDKDSLVNYFDPISLKLTEKGYPKIAAKSVYEICPEDLRYQNNGFINGQLINDIVKAQEITKS